MSVISVSINLTDIAQDVEEKEAFECVMFEIAATLTKMINMKTDWIGRLDKDKLLVVVYGLNEMEIESMGNAVNRSAEAKGNLFSNLVNKVTTSFRVVKDEFDSVSTLFRLLEA